MTNRPSGALFTNNRKQKDNHPDYNGNIELNRELVNSLVEQLAAGNVSPKLELAAWKKVSGKGTRYLSISPSIPFELTDKGKSYASNKGSGSSNTPPPMTQTEMDDEIPF